MLSARLIAIVITCCLIPPCLQWMGFDFSTEQYAINTEGGTADLDQSLLGLFLARGEIIHSLTEWTSVCLAFVTAALSFVHYFLKRDITTPVIATALTFTAMLDAFRVLALCRLVGDVPDPASFATISWAISRLFLITLLISGTLPFLIREPSTQRVARDFRDFTLLLVAYSLAAFVIIYYAGKVLVFSADQAIANDVSEKLNFAGLLLYAVGGGVVLTFYSARYRGIFAAAMVASLIPHSTAQLYATFGSTALYDAGYNLASVYKLFGYLVPAIGLMSDYRRASRADAELATTARQLGIARDIQLSLLPRAKPAIPAIDVAGFSVASEAVGGDYFDYITLPDGSLMAVVADVSGHDLGAALLMANARAYLKSSAEDESDVAEILNSLNRFISKDARGRRFITAMLVRIPAEGEISFVCAGHTGYIATADATYRTLHQRNVPLGVIDDLNAHANSESLANDETLVLLTDGLVELTNRSGEQLGIDRVMSIVAEHADQSADAVVDALQHAANEWSGSRHPFDDMTVVVLRRR